MDFTLEEAMTPCPYTIDALRTAAEAHDMLVRHNVRHLPVKHDGQVIGVLSERDVNLALHVADQAVDRISVFALCSKPAYLVEKSEPIAVVLRTLAEQHYGSVLVTDRGKLAGIVTASDLFLLMATWLEREAD